MNSVVTIFPCNVSRAYLPKSCQSGAALVLSLIVLSIITVVGLRMSMQTGVTFDIIQASQRQVRVFESAEVGLLRVESLLDQLAPQDSGPAQSCSGNQCFNATCQAGLCFDGVFTSNLPVNGCRLTPYSESVQRVEFWRDPTLNVWRDQQRHQSFMVDDVAVQYIIEFLCYFQMDDSQKDNFHRSGSLMDSRQVEIENSFAPMYRITVRSSLNNHAETFLQSTYLSSRRINSTGVNIEELLPGDVKGKRIAWQSM